MSANKKRRKLPEEDLAAAVADIINSPITRSNLSFLRPLATPASTENESPSPKPMGLEVTPRGDGLTPMGYISTPMGDETRTTTAGSPPLVSNASPNPDALETIADSNIGEIPMGVELLPMGLEPTPPGFRRPGAPSQPAIPYGAPATAANPPPAPAASQDQASQQPWQPPSSATTLWQAEGYGTFIE